MITNQKGEGSKGEREKGREKGLRELDAHVDYELPLGKLNYYYGFVHLSFCELIYKYKRRFQTNDTKKGSSKGC